MEFSWPALYQFFFLAVFFVPALLFLFTQQKTIKLIQPHNRSIAPGEVFLQLIPLFGMVWQFFVVTRLSDSIRRELGERTFTFEAPVSNNEQYIRPTYRIGITYCVLFCCYIIPFIGSFAFLAGMVCWIIYWVQLWNYKKKLEQKRYFSTSPPPVP